MLVKGLTLPNQEIVQKTILLTTHMLTRLQSILSLVYPSNSAASPLLNQLQGIFPGSDVASNLLKKILTCLAKEEPFEGKKEVKKEEEDVQPMVHLIIKNTSSMEVEDQDEDEDEDAA